MNYEPRKPINRQTKTCVMTIISSLILSVSNITLCAWSIRWSGAESLTCFKNISKGENASWMFETSVVRRLMLALSATLSSCASLLVWIYTWLLRALSTDISWSKLIVLTLPIFPLYLNPFKILSACLHLISHLGFSIAAGFP